MGSVSLEFKRTILNRANLSPSMESNIGIIAAFIPTLKPLFKTLASLYYLRRFARHTDSDATRPEDRHRLNNANQAPEYYPMDNYFQPTTLNNQIKVLDGRSLSDSSQQTRTSEPDVDHIRKTTDFRLETYEEPHPQRQASNVVTDAGVV